MIDSITANADAFRQYDELTANHAYTLATTLENEGGTQGTELFDTILVRLVKLLRFYPTKIGIDGIGEDIPESAFDEIAHDMQSVQDTNQNVYNAFMQVFERVREVIEPVPNHHFAPN